MHTPGFNGRFEPATYGGFPIGAVFAGGIALVSLTLTILFHFWFLRIFTVPAVIGGVVMAYIYLRLGDLIVFRRVMFDAWLNRSLLTHEHRSTD